MRNENTDRNQVPKLHKYLVNANLISPGMEILDFGSGRYVSGAKYLTQYGIFCTRYDPYKLPESRNSMALSKNYDAVLCSNVLNVIPTKLELLSAFDLATSLSKRGYFSIYEGDKTNVPRATKCGFQWNTKTKEMIKLIEENRPYIPITHLAMNMFYVG